MYYDRDKEISEAIVAADAALESLHNAEEYLDTARGWGIIDIVGGGFLSTMLKRNKMDDAKRELAKAKTALRSLTRELGDVREIQMVSLDTNDFLGFADYFMDGFFADILVQSKINEARNEIYRTIQKVEKIRARLIEIRGY